MLPKGEKRKANKFLHSKIFPMLEILQLFLTKLWCWRFLLKEHRELHHVNSDTFFFYESIHVQRPSRMNIALCFTLKLQYCQRWCYTTVINTVNYRIWKHDCRVVQHCNHHSFCAKLYSRSNNCNNSFFMTGNWTCCCLNGDSKVNPRIIYCQCKSPPAVNSSCLKGSRWNNCQLSLSGWWLVIIRKLSQIW